MFLPLSSHPAPFVSAFANYCRIVFGVLYWYVWTVLLPRWGGYHLEEEKAEAEDGAIHTKLVRVYEF